MSACSGPAPTSRVVNTAGDWLKNVLANWPDTTDEQRTRAVAILAGSKRRSTAPASRAA